MCRLFCYFVTMAKALMLHVETSEHEWLSQQSSLLVIGSCFAENIGRKLERQKFSTIVNPWGILYNPISIANNWNDALIGKTYGEEDIFYYDELWQSFNHHGAFANMDKESFLIRANSELQRASEILSKDDAVIVVTLGNAWVYEKDEKVVANCHKLPASTFTKRLLTVEEIVAIYEPLISALRSTQRVIFTVSPVRYAKDGLHNSMLSKSILMLAIDKLVSKDKRLSYFPAYEIVIDELRDYRFFNEDFVHPNDQAINWVWNKFIECYCSVECMAYMRQLELILKDVSHRLLFPQTDASQKFVANTEKKLKDFALQHNVDMDKELEINRLKLEIV